MPALRLVLVPLLVLAVAGCGSSLSSRSGPPSVSGTRSATTGSAATAGMLRARLARAPAAVAPVEAAALAADNATFAGRILALLSRGESTIALSPLSISESMAMAYAGARGQTAVQMQAALAFSLPPARLHQSFNALDLSLDQVNAPGATLAVANALYGQQGLAIRTPFLTVLARDYGSGVRTVDFERAPDAARMQINAWVDQQTDGKIADLLSPADVDGSTRLMLVNAVYLNAKWQSPFSPDATAPAPFHAPGGAVTVATMNQTGTFAYRRESGYRVLELPYQGDRLALDILFPDPGRLSSLLAQLRTTGGLPAAVSDLQPTWVALALPKLELRTRVELAGALSALGMPAAFSSGADFSGITGAPGDLQIARVIHEAYIRIDEAGTQAAAATAAGASASAVVGRAIQFDVDRPFVFLLRDTTTGAVLFAGTVSLP